MLNRELVVHILAILLFVILQVLVFNNIQFLGRFNPLIFLMYIMFAPIQFSFHKILLYSFFLGLCLDVCMGTLGVNTFCCLFTVLLRAFFLHRVFSKGEGSFLEFRDLNALQNLSYIFSISMFYNLLLYSIDSFSFSNFLYAIEQGIYNGLFTFVCILIFFLLFKRLIRE